MLGGAKDIYWEQNIRLRALELGEYKKQEIATSDKL